MEVIHFIIELLIGIGIFSAVAVMLSIVMEWVQDKLNIKTIDNTHHDHRKGSFYSIAHQVRRDEQKRRGY